MKKSNWKVYLVSILIPLAVGILAAIITNSSMEQFERLDKPWFAPPSWLFPIAWTILYTLMGISSAMIYLSAQSKERTEALWLYAAQLFVNFWWPLFFFMWGLRLFAFVWILLLIALVIGMITRFYRIKPVAGLLQLPYLLWLLFASALNLSIFALNG
ncbi:MAG: TspO/MBR family protein [Clostridia bacterium]|nr:TspO/MBR family protein [Clostridia bacterium]